MTKNTPTLAALADDLENGRTSARRLVDDCLARITDPSGEGARTFLHVDAEAAIEAAEAMDRLREVKAAPSPFAGIPVSIKDLFDIKGHVPRGSSSGAAVSVVDRMAHGGLGTDTGGSCRIPAAYNGIVGFKPTQRRIPLD